jgi:mono/diheme cytochrome c family protein
MKALAVLFSIILIVVIFTAFTGPAKPVKIPASKQRSGDARKGYEYLTTGDYIKSGIPYNFFLMAFGKSNTNYLKRTGNNEVISHEYTAVNAFNGEVVVAPNCLQCHAQVFEGKLIMGLGNSLVDFTRKQATNPQTLNVLEAFLKKNSPKQYEAAETFITVTKTIAPYLNIETRGVNIADHLAAVLAAHRDPKSFRWRDTAYLKVSNEGIIPTDTPAWWLLKKKNAMFYSGFGRGDFGRFLMASNLLTTKDTSESRQVDDRIPDVLAYINSLQPPPYPKDIDQQLSSKGRLVFEKNCSSCHGTYGSKGKYPNLLIPESIIKTDPTLFTSSYSSSQFIDWFNKSWFTEGHHPAKLKPFKGYIAPPLDGIWITAPYLHNGSVPNLETLLNSRLRPKYWSRDITDPVYDYEKIGWKYSVDSVPVKYGYNTEMRGYGNYGHYFGDRLTDADRKAVIEYLKSL